VLALLLVLENSAFSRSGWWNKIIAEGSGSLFGAEVPQIEHEHDDEHDSPNFGICVDMRLAENRRVTSLRFVNCFTRASERRELDDRFFAHFSASQFPGQPALPHHQHSIGQCDYFRKTDGTAVEFERSGVWPEGARYNLHKCALAGAVFS
jgi:hypothetical protein